MPTCSAHRAGRQGSGGGRGITSCVLKSSLIVSAPPSLPSSPHLTLWRSPSPIHCDSLCLGHTCLHHLHTCHKALEWKILPVSQKESIRGDLWDVFSLDDSYKEDWDMAPRMALWGAGGDRALRHRQGLSGQGSQRAASEVDVGLKGDAG